MSLLVSPSVDMTTGPVGANEGQPSDGFKFPAAVGGLNRRDSKAQMPATDANILQNVFPYPTFCQVRKGNEQYATGLSGSIETLMEWAGPSSRKFFAANNSSIYDISTAGAVGAADVTGLSSIRFQWINFATAGGTFLVACNGSDDVQNFDGTTWTTPAITGVTSADLINVAAWKSRLWFVEKNSTNAWYLPVSSIAGAATKLALGAQFKLGGFLNAIGSFSYDAGDGPDDYIAFMSDQGEVVVYQGTDPSSATTFSLVGRFRMGMPIGRRSMIQVGGDLAVICVDGVVSLIKSMQLDRSAAQKAAVTNKIQNLFNEYAISYRGNFGWQAQIYPLGPYVAFNIPYSTTEFRQLVMNTDTGAWCEFTNWNGPCFGLYNDDIYFGGTDGVVYKANTGNQDDGSPITFDYQSAFSDFGAKGMQKIFHMIRSLFITNGSPTVLQSMNVDFSDVEPVGTLTPTVPASSTWDTATWDGGQWAGLTPSYQWSSVGQVGEWGAVRLSGSLNGISLQINSFTIQAEVGGSL